ncbi:MAG: TRAP transporter large permease, partial [Proteobacteria bacterium]|nr:TRAP transporter large permease [Pseudomonadota bacterium]
MDTSALIVLLMLLGMMAAYVPVFMALFFTSVFSFLLFSPQTPILLLTQTLFRSMDNFALVVVLFFIL